MIAVKIGPVFASRVALATEVFLTPIKKSAKCKPKKIPAKTILLRFFGNIGTLVFVAPYNHSIPLAVNILQNARVRAGTNETCLITREVELTETMATRRNT
tara:strand:+ start:59 stop:361 length:303 start_codon:yes stop_codon:yes gene_type:complete